MNAMVSPAGRSRRMSVAAEVLDDDDCIVREYCMWYAGTVVVDGTTCRRCGVVMVALLAALRCVHLQIDVETIYVGGRTQWLKECPLFVHTRDF